ncbi:MAG TPA: hypothetical protein PKJ19_14200 [Flavobacteriales bacterium]|nr:hypothetical protein [Flavobacteriales bacterium]
MTAPPEVIIEHCVRAFNAKAHLLGYGKKAMAHIPLKPERLKENEPGNKHPGSLVYLCRSMCMYAIGQHCLVESPFGAGQRPLVYAAIGAMFNRATSTAHMAARGFCAHLENEVIAEIYRDALSSIIAEGHELWRVNTGRPKCIEV